jgi:hypothetical protein
VQGSELTAEFSRLNRYLALFGHASGGPYERAGVVNPQTVVDNSAQFESESADAAT